MRDVEILGNKFTDMTVGEFFAELDKIVRAGRSEVVLNTNVHGIHLASKNPWLREFRNRNRITHCDGAGVVLGARILGHQVNPRVSLNDFVWDFAAFCAERGHSIFLLGARQEVIEGAAHALCRHSPRLRIAGTHHGYFAKNGPETDAVIDLINRARPNILMVGFGMPIQEAWIKDNAHRIRVNVIWAVGGIFDRVAGVIPLAPKWVMDCGLEWLYLSVKNPRRFVDRYLIENPIFISRVFAERLRSLLPPAEGPRPRGGTGRA